MSARSVSTRRAPARRLLRVLLALPLVLAVGCRATGYDEVAQLMSRHGLQPLVPARADIEPGVLVAGRGAEVNQVVDFGGALPESGVEVNASAAAWFSDWSRSWGSKVALADLAALVTGFGHRAEAEVEGNCTIRFGEARVLDLPVSELYARWEELPDAWRRSFRGGKPVVTRALVVDGFELTLSDEQALRAQGGAFGELAGEWPEAVGETIRVEQPMTLGVNVQPFDRELHARHQHGEVVEWIPLGRSDVYLSRNQPWTSPRGDLTVRALQITRGSARFLVTIRDAETHLDETRRWWAGLLDELTVWSGRVPYRIAIVRKPNGFHVGVRISEGITR